MKKILLFALPLLAMIAVSCEKDNGKLSGNDIIEFKDPNFLKALLTVQEIYIDDAETNDEIPYMMDVDANKDGKISVNEAQKVKALHLMRYETGESFNIKEMPEIKYFTALTELICPDNQLTSLNVSNNTALMRLVCDNNKLTTLDASNNTALEVLFCNDNKLITLDISKNAALKNLYCSDNQLISLDISKNTVLTELTCDNNKLTTLDASNNTALEVLFCNDNKLTKIILPTNHSLEGYTTQRIIDEYGNIIEYR